MPTLFVPGRLCLVGEHSDWAGAWRVQRPDLPAGRCLVTATDQGLYAEADAAEGIVELASVLPDGTAVGPLRLPAEAAALAREAAAGGFFAYAAGVLAETMARHDVRGLRLRVTRADLPAGRGLSSSAAVCVLVARACGVVWGLGLDVRAEMDLAWAGERRAGSACGRMDQVCAYGRRTLDLVFDGDRLDVAPVEPGGPLWLLVADLGRGKDTRRILADLNACFPDTPGSLAAGVRDALGRRNAAILARAVSAVEAGDAGTLGAVMTEAQAVFDACVAPACPELRAPRLHEALAHPALRELAWGGKGVGSQGDGAVQVVARGPGERDALAARLARDLGVACLPLTIGTPAP